MVYVEQLILAMLLSITLTTLGEDEMGLELLHGMEECVCPGQSLTYECTVMGDLGGQSVWRGSLFDNYCTSLEISLFHSNFDSTDGSSGECGEIMGRSVRVNITETGRNNNSIGYFVSQISVPVSSNTAGKNIKCEYDNGDTILPVGNMMIPAETGPGAVASPDRLHMSNADFVTRQLTFKWSPVAPDCPAIHYNILTSNCGSCPTTTNHTNVTCTDIPTDGSTCTLAVQTVSCGYITGNASDPISITLYTQTPTTDDLHVYPTGKLTTHSSDTATEPAGTHPINSNSAVYVISIGSLATGLIASAVLFTTVTAIILRRSKVKVSAALELSQRGADGTTHDDPVYEEVAGASLHSIISTQDNVAYRHTKKVNTERITALITVP